MTTYEKLHSRIVELIPEIEELKFGCFVERFGRIYHIVSRQTFGKVLTTYTCVDEHGDTHYVAEEEVKKIIGRPITYEDIVVAIKRRCGVPDKERADLMQTAAGASCLAVGNRWHWQKPLEQQDEETLLFIDKILEI